VISDWTVLVRILVAAALGGTVGIERELRDQPAGFRTHMMVSLGACLFTLIGVFAFGRGENSGTDFTRIASQVVVGIGFLGGGTILRHGSTVRGLTTAASLWVTAAVGVAVGMGFYFAATTVAVLTVVALAGLKPIEKRFMRGVRQEDEPPETIPPN
jgi:putative Mg2+ transporter-C (MgtC) family protein